jgi:hypothetical protein
VSVVNKDVLQDMVAVEYENGEFPATITGFFVEGHMAGIPGTYQWDKDSAESKKVVNNQQELRDAIMLLVDRLFPAPTSPA